MKKIIIVFLLVITSINSYAGVGISEITLSDKTRDRILSGYILYPTNDVKNQETYAENIAFYGFTASSSRTIAKDKLPLYILAHGTSGNWKNLSWLAKELAKRGLVVTVNHPDYTTGQATAKNILKPWNQAKDISFLISELLLGEYAIYIDQKQIFTIGHSLGGYSAMALAGARIDLTKMVKFCNINSDKSCSYFKSALSKLTQEHIQIAKESLLDKRIKAVVELAPGFTESMLLSSLSEATTPMLIISAENDLNFPPKTHLANIPNNIAQYQIDGASHFSFLQLCKENAKVILAEDAAAFVCDDGGIKKRAEIHREAIEQIEKFLLVSVQ